MKKCFTYHQWLKHEYGFYFGHLYLANGNDQIGLLYTQANFVETFWVTELIWGQCYVYCRWLSAFCDKNAPPLLPSFASYSKSLKLFLHIIIFIYYQLGFNFLFSNFLRTNLSISPMSKSQWVKDGKKLAETVSNGPVKDYCLLM